MVLKTKPAVRTGQCGLYPGKDFRVGLQDSLSDICLSEGSGVARGLRGCGVHWVMHLGGGNDTTTVQNFENLVILKILKTFNSIMFENL